MPDSTETVQVALDDLLELMAIAVAGELVSTFFNADDPVPAWEATGWTLQGIRERTFPGFDELDDDAFAEHPSVGGVQDRAILIVAGILQSMLDDERELVGMASLFDGTLASPTWPIPLHLLRRQMRDRIEAMTGIVAIHDRKDG